MSTETTALPTPAEDRLKAALREVVEYVEDEWAHRALSRSTSVVANLCADASTTSRPSSGCTRSAAT